MAFFNDIPLNTNISKIPTLLIDISESTSINFIDKSILRSYIDVINNHVDSDYYNLIFWNSNDINKDNIYANILKEELNNIINSKKSNSATDISTAFHYMPKSWLVKNDIDIYILTDGQTNRDKYNFNNQIKELFKTERNIRLNIITIEGKNTDYKKHYDNIGNPIYYTLKENNLMKYVKLFVSYNRLYKNKCFINYLNFDDDNNIQYGDKYFNIINLKDFLIYIKNEIINNETNDLDNNELIYNLAMTTYKILLKMPKTLHYDFINIICGLFTINNYNISYTIRNEINNHFSGKSNTLQDYNKTRDKLFERANESLKENIKNCISIKNKFMSFTKNKIIVSDYSQIKESIKFDKNNYKNGCITINECKIPIFPYYDENMNIGKHEFNNQCLRQWMRLIYGLYFVETVNSDRLLYLILTLLCINYNSTDNLNTKKAISNLALIMYDRRRYGSGGIKEIDFIENNKPLLLTGEDIDETLDYCILKFGLNIDNTNLWLNIVKMFENVKILNTQMSLYQCEIIVELEFNKIETIYYYTEEVEKYNCLDNTFEIVESDVEYNIKPHTIGNNITCSPKIKFNTIINKCPICYEENIECLNLCNVIKEKYNYDDVIIDDFYKLNTEIIDNLVKSNRYKRFEECNFRYKDFKINNYLTIENDKNINKIQIKTIDEFNEIMNKKYGFINELNMKNLCVAGGLCRSILYNETENDIDIFCYGLSKTELLERYKEYIKDLNNYFKTKNMDVKLITLYKENTNVLELLCMNRELFVDCETVKDVLDNNDNFKLLYKVQLILVAYETIQDIADNFDCEICKLFYKDNNLYLGEYTELCLRYNVNMIIKPYTRITNEIRLIKYYYYGFNIICYDENEKNKYNEIISSGTYIDDDGEISTNKTMGKLYNNIINKTRINTLYNNIINTGTNLYNNIVDKNHIVNNTFSYIEFMNKNETIIYYKLLKEDYELSNYDNGHIEIEVLYMDEVNDKRGIITLNKLNETEQNIENDKSVKSDSDSEEEIVVKQKYKKNYIKQVSRSDNDNLSINSDTSKEDVVLTPNKDTTENSISLILPTNNTV